MPSDTIRAVLIRTDGTVSVEELPVGSKMLDTVWALVGGFVQGQDAYWDGVRLSVMLDEARHEKKLARNPLATEVGHSTGALAPAEFYSGAVLITAVDEDDDLVDAPESLIHKLQKVASE